MRAGRAVYGNHHRLQLEGAEVHRLGEMELLQVLGPPNAMESRAAGLVLREFSSRASCQGTGCPGFVPVMGMKFGLEYALTGRVRKERRVDGLQLRIGRCRW